MAPKKVGTAPIQASGVEYEFDLAGELNLEYILTISKSRCPELSSTSHLNPGQELADTLSGWLTDGVPLPESSQSKCERVRVAREAVGLETEAVKSLMQQQYSRTTPAQLSSEQVDALVEMIAASQYGKH